MSAKIEPVLTVADLEAMPEDGNRYELIEGELIVSRAPGLTHQRVLTNLVATFTHYLERNPIGEVIPTPGVIFDELNSVIPDLVFLTNAQVARVGSEERINMAPELLVEIVSPGKENARRDRVMKRQVYGRFGVKEYWVADPEARTLEIYRLIKRTLRLVDTLTGEDEINSPVLPGFKCKVSQIFSR